MREKRVVMTGPRTYVTCGLDNLRRIKHRNYQKEDQP
jgi:hypothetical protein